MAPLSAVRAAKSQHEAVQWLEKFFFEQPKNVDKKKFRGGALRILDKKVARLRSGAFEDRGISRSARVIPVVVPFEGVPEGGILYKWLDLRCSQLRLLQQRDVSPLTVAMVDDYEALMALASRGHSLRGLLLEKATDEWRLSRLENLLLERATGRGDLRLPLYERAFDAIYERVGQRLFGERLVRE